MTPREANDRPQAAVFDMDGVITMTAHVHQAAWKQLFDEFLANRPVAATEDHRPFDGEDYRVYVDGKPRSAGVRDFLASRGISLPEGGPDDSPDAETVRALGLRKNAAFRKLVIQQGVQVDQATVRLVRGLRSSGVRVGLATSSENGPLILEQAGLGDLFEARVDASVSAKLKIRGKPQPDIFIECARRLGATPARTIVVEDAESGVAAGRTGGFGLVIGIDRGGNWLRLREAGADWIVTDVQQLPPERVESYWRARSDARPNALLDWNGVAQRLRGEQLAVFLGYDGTLLDHPEFATADADLRDRLAKLAGAWPTCIVASRSLEDIRHLVGMETLWYVVNNGFDIAAPRGLPSSRRLPPELAAEIRGAAQELRRASAHISGALIDDEGWRIAVHCRGVRDARLPELEALVDRVVAERPSLEKQHGDGTFRIRPALDWDKGKALLWLLQANGLEHALPVYVGNDETDEEAFAAVAQRGLGILVTEIPRPTAARYLLQDSFEVRLFLERLTRMRRGSQLQGAA